MNTKWIFVTLFLAAVSSSVFAGDVNVSISTREAYVGNPITLRVEIANANSHDAPRIEPMDGVDIRAVGTPSRSSQVSIINGRRSEKTSVTYAFEKQLDSSTRRNLCHSAVAHQSRRP